VFSALEMALFRRDVPPGQLTHHADHGSQYTSLAFSQRLADAGIAASMGSIGDAYDNSLIGSFWGSIQTELLYRHVWPTRHDAEMAIFEWIESWCNRHRLHFVLGYLSPEQYEQQHHDTITTTAPATVAAN
jgi:putative transposase